MSDTGMTLPPPPWRVERDQVWKTPFLRLVDRDGETVLAGVYAVPFDRTLLEAIVTAVNSHDALLKQCTDLHEWFVTFRDDLVADGYGDDAMDDMIDQLQAAIVAAGGTP